MEPQRFAGDETGHVLTANEWDVLAEACPVKLDESVAVAILFVVHGLEGPACFGKIGPDALGKIAVNAGRPLLRPGSPARALPGRSNL